jgi:hypothetical protein
MLKEQIYPSRSVDTNLRSPISAGLYYLRTQQNPDYDVTNDGGFTYQPPKISCCWAGSNSYGAMTAAGVWGLRLVGEFLYYYLLGFSKDLAMTGIPKVGYERVQKIEYLELAQKRMKETYKLKGYSDEWIEKRVRGVAIRDELTDQWDKRGANSQQEFSILTAEISGRCSVYPVRGT